MKNRAFRSTPILLAAILSPLLSINTAHAQTTVPNSGAVPPASAAPEAYRSAFDGYQGYAEEKITDWRAANDAVERIGGWREYAKQAQQPANTPAQTIKAGDAARQEKP